MGAIKEMAIEIEERGMRELENVRDYITGGRGTFTLMAIHSMNRFTYSIRTPAEKTTPLFVSLLNGPDNTANYEFLGTIFENDGHLDYRPSHKSRITRDAQSNKALAWFLGNINQGQIPPTVAFFHEGKCARCGRKLTTPESIKRGLGPHCASKES